MRRPAAAGAAALVAVWALWPRPLKERAEAVIAAVANDRPREDVLSAYRRVAPAELAPDRLASLDNRTLELAFEAVDLATQGEKNEAASRALESIQAEALKRGYLGGIHMPRRLFERALRDRDLSLARRVAESFPSLAVGLPRATIPSTASGPGVLRVSRDGQELSWIAAPLRGPRLVAVVSPGCHFSRDAMAALAKHPAARRAAARALWIDPGGLDGSAELARANRGSWFRYDFLYRPEDWPALDFRGTPRFYFLEDGRAARVVEGYRPAEFLAEFDRGLASIGLDADRAR